MMMPWKTPPKPCGKPRWRPCVPDLDSLDASQLEHMSIDELRVVAKALDVPGRAQITEQDELIEAIRRCL